MILHDVDHGEFHCYQMDQEDLVGDLPEPHHRPGREESRVPALVAQRQRRHGESGDGRVEHRLVQRLRQPERRRRRIAGDRRRGDEVADGRERQRDERVTPHTHLLQHRQAHAGEKPDQVGRQPQPGAVGDRRGQVHPDQPHRRDQRQRRRSRKATASAATAVRTALPAAGRPAAEESRRTWLPLRDSTSGSAPDADNPGGN